MEFPETKFTKKFRTIYFIFIIIAFFVITPLVILYTAGFKYDFTYGIVRETGGISIDIEPKESNIYIDDILIKQKLPIRIKNITPKKYKIKIDAGNDYYLWEKEIEVKKRQTIYIKEISLIKKTSPELLKTGNVTSQKLSNDGKYLAYILISNNLPEVWINDLQNNEDKLIMRFGTSKNFELIWGEKHNYLTISQNDSVVTELYIINAEKQNEIIDLIKKTKETIYKFSWKNSSDPEIFYSTLEKLYSFKPNTRTNQSITENNFIDWYMENGELWTLNYNEEEENYNIIQDTLGFFKKIKILNDKKYNNYKIEIAKNNHILLKHRQKPEMILLNKNNRYDIAGEKAYISKYNNWWLIWTPWELRTYSYGEEPQLINRSGEQLEKVVPLDEFNTLGLIWNDKATVLFPYYLVRHDFIKEKINNVEVNIENKILYFTNEKGIWKLEY